jgi:hypothetical protein
MAQKYFGTTAREVEGAALIGRHLTQRKITMELPFSVAKVPFGFNVTEKATETAIGLHINALEGALAEVMIAFMAATGQKYTFDNASAAVYRRHFPKLGRDGAGAEEKHFQDSVQRTWAEINELNKE